MACVRVQARDPDALANVRIAYGPYARRCGVCARTPRRARPRAEPNCTSPRVSCERRALSVALQTVLAQPLTGVRSSGHGLRTWVHAVLLSTHTTVLQHELFFSQYEL